MPPTRHCVLRAVNADGTPGAVLHDLTALFSIPSAAAAAAVTCINIGRKQTQHVVLQPPPEMASLANVVSRHHAQLELQDRDGAKELRFRLPPAADAKSPGKSKVEVRAFVNGAAIKADGTPLEHGDRLAFYEDSTITTGEFKGEQNPFQFIVEGVETLWQPIDLTASVISGGTTEAGPTSSAFTLSDSGLAGRAAKAPPTPTPPADSARTPGRRTRQNCRREGATEDTALSANSDDLPTEPRPNRSTLRMSLSADGSIRPRAENGSAAAAVPRQLEAAMDKAASGAAAAPARRTRSSSGNQSNGAAPAATAARIPSAAAPAAAAPPAAAAAQPAGSMPPPLQTARKSNGGKAVIARKPPARKACGNAAGITKPTARKAGSGKQPAGPNAAAAVQPLTATQNAAGGEATPEERRATRQPTAGQAPTAKPAAAAAAAGKNAAAPGDKQSPRKRPRKGQPAKRTTAAAAAAAAAAAQAAAGAAADEGGPSNWQQQGDVEAAAGPSANAIKAKSSRVKKPARKTNSGKRPGTAVAGAEMAAPKRPKKNPAAAAARAAAAAAATNPDVDIPEVVPGQELIWAPGTEPWRALGIPVNTEPDLRPEMIKRVTDCQQNYYKKFNVAKHTEAERVKIPRTDGKKPSMRPDRVAQKLMAKAGLELNDGKTAGHFPGVAVHHRFYARAEMACCNLHFPPLGGIDFVATNDRDLLQASRGIPYALSIMVSGGYEDDVDNGKTLWYTGQGGNDLLSSRKQIDSQKLKQGNCALVGNIRLGIPVRVTRSNTDGDAVLGRVFIYDGLYDVVEYKEVTGKSQHVVYKYRLGRQPGQGELQTKAVRFKGCSAPRNLNSLSRPGIIDTDIAGGLEKLKVPACNELDDEPPPCTAVERIRTHKQVQGVACHPRPAGWRPSVRYVTDMELAEGIRPAAPVLPPQYADGDGHDWIAALNLGRLPYIEGKGNKPNVLVETQRIVYECGPWNSNCPHGEACTQRVTQQGLKFRLQLEKKPHIGWGVISWDTIPAGAYVATYNGKVITADEADKSGSNYLLDLGPRIDFDDDGVMLQDPADIQLRQSKYVLDARNPGGISRFFNHSCEPTLFVQPVLSRHHNEEMPYMAFFATCNIPPFTPLMFDYGESFVTDMLGGQCRCGSANCISPANDP